MFSGGTRLLCLLLLAQGAQATTRVQLAVFPHEAAYPAGTELRVVIPRQALAEAEEFELLLRAPGLKVELVRLTPSLEATPTTLTLRVPHLPWCTAHLELRVGRGGREDTAARSHTFTIVPQTTMPLVTLTHRSGEWWVEAGTPIHPIRGSWVEAFQLPQAGALPLPLLPARSFEGLVQVKGFSSERAPTREFSGALPLLAVSLLPRINFPKRE